MSPSYSIWRVSGFFGWRYKITAFNCPHAVKDYAFTLWGAQRMARRWARSEVGEHVTDV